MRERERECGRGSLERLMEAKIFACYSGTNSIKEWSLSNPNENCFSSFHNFYPLSFSSSFVVKILVIAYKIKLYVKKLIYEINYQKEN